VSVGPSGAAGPGAAGQHHWELLTSIAGTAPVAGCASGEQQMEGCGISTAALISSLITALPPFPLGRRLQSCFGLQHATSIFSWGGCWVLGCAGPAFPARAEHGDCPRAPCEACLGSRRLFWRDASPMLLVCVSCENCRVVVDTLLQSLFRKSLLLMGVLDPRPKPAGVPERSGEGSLCHPLVMPCGEPTV